LKGQASNTDTLKRTPDAPKRIPEDPKRVAGEAPAPPKEEAPAPSPKEAAKPAATAPAPKSAPAPAPSDVPKSGKPGVWLVQVIATRDQAMATSVVKKLAAKNYPVFLVAPVAGAPQPFYKVQVGRYPDRGEAERVSQRIKKEEQFQSWILR
jgi:cell division septation protein DedD